MSLPAPSFPALELPRLGAWPPALRWAVGVSLVVHAVVLGWLPGRQQAEQLVRQPLQLLLATPAPSAPVPPASTLAMKPADVPVQAPTRMPRRSADPLPAPTRELQPMTAAPAAASSTPAPSIALPVETVAAPTPPAPVARTTAPDPAALTAYGRHLAGAVAAHQRYPRLAQLRQWQGTTLLQLELAADGGVQGMRVVSSSGHEILDKQALDMLRAALPLPPLPPSLAGRALTIDVPVVFRLAS